LTESSNENLEGYYTGSYYIRAQMMPSIREYIEKGRLPGSFLTAVICNDLSQACLHADQENLRNLPAFVHYFYWNAPSPCWGSADKVKDWISIRRQELEEHDREESH